VTDDYKSIAYDSGQDEDGSYRGFLAFLLFAIAAILVSVLTPLGSYFNTEHIRALTYELGYWGPVALVGVSLVAPFFFLPRWPIAWVAGLLYGIYLGTTLAVLACTLGAIVNYALARSLLAKSANRAMHKFGINEGQLSDKRLFYLFFFLRAFPFSNYVATNLLGGALKVPMRVFVASTVIGSIPSTLMYASWGKIAQERSSSVSLVAMVSLVFIICICLVAKRYFLPWIKELKSGRKE